MKVFKSEQIGNIDAFTIKHEPIQSIDLMERAANALLKWIIGNYSSQSPFFIFVGPGNNGGDGLALARLLIEVGFHVKVFVLASKDYSNDNRVNLQRLIKQGITLPIVLYNVEDFPEIPPNAILVDSLFGSGLSRQLTGVAAELVKYFNASGNHIVSIDIPSGLHGEENPFPNQNPIVRAQVTLTLQFPKLSFFFSENDEYIGNWHVIDIGLHHKIIKKTISKYHFVDIDLIRGILIPRSKFAHKGNYGHCLIIAGSYGMLGAAILCSHACIRAGAGLVTVHIPRLGYSVLQHCLPEAIVQVDDNDWYFTGVPKVTSYSAIGIGPGIGKETRTISGFQNLLTHAKCPLVIDADGLNILASVPELLSKLPKNTILTPHVGEFNRLFGTSDNGFQRLRLAQAMSAKYKVIIIVKGAYSQIVYPSGEVYFNNTGNPGMATGGSGDVLTGIITSLLSQGYSPNDAAVAAVYLHGKAGDLAALNFGHQSLKASDIIECLGQAFLSVE